MCLTYHFMDPFLKCHKMQLVPFLRPLRPYIRTHLNLFISNLRYTNEHGRTNSYLCCSNHKVEPNFNTRHWMYHIPSGNFRKQMPMNCVLIERHKHPSRMMDCKNLCRELALKLCVCCGLEGSLEHLRVWQAWNKHRKYRSSSYREQVKLW